MDNLEKNIEQKLIEAEAVEEQLAEDDECISVEDEIDYQFDATAIQERMMADARKKADKILRKNKREIARLKKHAGECLIKNNYYGYQYAIKKLRDYYKQPYNEELIKSMWNTSRQSLLDIIEQAKEV